MDILLESLVGKHSLSGAFFDSVEVKDDWSTENRIVLRFTLDGKNYEAVEDSNDGYRSTLGKLRECAVPPQFTFIPCDVIGKMKEKTDEDPDDEVLQFLNAGTGSVVMEIGTSDCTDYYPGFVAEFNPGNLKTN